MLCYSRNYFLSLRFWWKSVSPTVQTSRHIQAQPLSCSVWSAIRDAGIVKRMRGCRGGRSSARTHRIWPLEPALRVNTKKAYSNSVSTEADRRVHSTVTNGFINNIRIRRQPIKSTVNTSKPMSFAVLNTRSVRKKTLPVKDQVVEQDVDIFAITESWLSRESDEFIIRDLCLTGYEFRNVPRGSRSGGLGILHKSTIHFQKQSGIKGKFKSFEFMDLLLKQSSTSLRVVIVYRPQTMDNNKCSTSLFFEEFSRLLEALVTAPGSLLMAGDFNFHVDVPSDRDAQRFLRLLETFNLKQHLNVPTHRSGHTLDLVITTTRSDENVASKCDVYDPSISDHFVVSCMLSLPKTSFERKEICCRKLKSIDMQTFRDEISNSALASPSSIVGDLEQLTAVYDLTLSSLVDKHAPLKTRIVTVRPSASWYWQ